MTMFQIPGWEIIDQRRNKSTPLAEVFKYRFWTPTEPDLDDFDETASQDHATWIGKIFADKFAILAAVSEDSRKLIVSDDLSIDLQRLLMFYWEWDAWGSLAHLIASFDLDPTEYIGEVADSWVGPVKIWQTHHYFANNIGTPVDDYVRDDFGKHEVWDSYAEAQEWVDSQDDVDQYGRITYHLKGGQSSPTEFTICKA